MQLYKNFEEYDFFFFFRYINDCIVVTNHINVRIVDAISVNGAILSITQRAYIRNNANSSVNIAAKILHESIRWSFIDESIREKKIIVVNFVIKLSEQAAIYKIIAEYTLERNLIHATCVASRSEYEAIWNDTSLHTRERLIALTRPKKVPQSVKHKGMVSRFLFQSIVYFNWTILTNFHKQQLIKEMSAPI